MEPSLEIRKLRPSDVRELVQMLECHDMWKCLMSIIPSKLEKNNFAVEVTQEKKYHSEHFKLIENASIKYKRDCTEILFDEWGTSGRVRPSLGHLLDLLTKAKLYRAADYVAVNLLNQPKPPRPNDGPEALISVDLPDLQIQRPLTTEDENLEELLDSIDYPRAAIELIRRNSDTARAKEPIVIPKIIISPDVVENTHAPTFTSPVVIQRERSNSDVNQSVSNSSDSLERTQEHPSSNGELQNNIRAGDQSLPNFDIMSDSVTDSTDNNNAYGESDVCQSSYAPALDKLLDTPNTNKAVSEEHEIQNNSECSYQTDFPNLDSSGLLSSDHLPNLPVFHQDQNLSSESRSSYLPDFDALRTSKAIGNLSSAQGPLHNVSSAIPTKSFSTHLLPISSNTSQNSSDTSTKSRPCTSPLPNLSLNTLLPHLDYCELEAATNNFNEKSFTNENDTGRFLGSGAFGSVFLAFGLLDGPVAVKKLFLEENVEIVNVDDAVTKQFRNEVEVLSKYKHENLLSLLGYSCNGCTYCLLYEYISGGALKDRLQVTHNKLEWKERWNIALGTAKAISYLHTAFSTQLIHRDIKSANILLDNRNQPKLCDFGLIKLAPSQNIDSHSGNIFGTSAYMAPEGFSGDISVKLDTFSFGVVLLELLTSLAPEDEDREGGDLVTYVLYERCENKDITPVLDVGAGSWKKNGINYADELFIISLMCLEDDPRKRPEMTKILALLGDIGKNINM